MRFALHVCPLAAVGDQRAVDLERRGPPRVSSGPGVRSPRRRDPKPDGGIDAETAGPCARAGATLFVAGTSVFGSDDPAAAVEAIAAAVDTR